MPPSSVRRDLLPAESGTGMLSTIAFGAKRNVRAEHRKTIRRHARAQYDMRL